MQDLSTVGKFHFEPPITSFDHLVGEADNRTNVACHSFWGVDDFLRDTYSSNSSSPDCTVRLTRKLREFLCWSACILARLAERKLAGGLSQAPPRTSRLLQLLSDRALPSPGLPSLLSFQQSSVHSQTLPCTL